VIRCGDTILAGEADGPLHLKIVATAPHDGKVVLVSITTRRAKSEELVVLQPSDHPWLKHESVATFAYSEIVEVESIEDALRAGDAVREASADAALLGRVQQGLLESDRTPQGVCSFARAAGLMRE
jgi:hypothetical protein